MFADGDTEPARRAIRGSNIEIIAHALDLDLAPGRLLDRVGEIAEEVAHFR